MMKNYSSLRWVLLGAGIVAILALTGMNVYSLYRLHETTTESEVENKKIQINEFTDKVRNRFFKPFRGLPKVDIENVEEEFIASGQFPEIMIDFLNRTDQDSIFSDIYFIPDKSYNCHTGGEIYRYNSSLQRFEPTRSYPEQICDGASFARTRMKVLIDEYLYNNKVIFDTHRTMTLALINLTDHQVFGYLTMPIDQDYMIQNYLQPLLTKKFGETEQTGLSVWLVDWTKDQVVAASDSTRMYDRDLVQYRQKFPDLFDDWSINVSFRESPTIAASKESLIKNLVVLGVTFILLTGALVFMFITAQRERALAQRQAGFLANVTHELKTPLAVMQAAGENLSDGRVDDTERLRSYGKHIYKESIRLKRMIEKLLDVAKSDAGQAMIEPKPVNLDQLLRNYLDSHASYIKEKGFELHADIRQPLPLVMLDPDSFETIMSNLLNNAIKYSRKEKYISLTLRRVKDKIVLSVSDRGVGIPKKSLKYIFDKFYRVEDALVAQTKGHGLGLSIVKSLVELNAGEITVKSEKNKGTTFSISFPVFIKTEKKTGKEQPKDSQITSDTPEYVG
jgi:signal transduction histidine kinase